jgi:hypothetical protein
MNSPIKSIYIPHVEEGITAEYIIDVFYLNDIATVSKITLIPHTYPSKYTGETYSHAFIDINNWHETEAAYGFIQHLRRKNEETRLNHTCDSWWIVEINKKPWITSMPLFENETTINYLVEAKVYEIICDLKPTFQMAKNNLISNLVNRLHEYTEWRDIELSLFEEKAYQQLEDDLCL